LPFVWRAPLQHQWHLCVSLVVASPAMNTPIEELRCNECPFVGITRYHLRRHQAVHLSKAERATASPRPPRHHLGAWTFHDHSPMMVRESRKRKRSPPTASSDSCSPPSKAVCSTVVPDGDEDVVVVVAAAASAAASDDSNELVGEGCTVRKPASNSDADDDVVVALVPQDNDEDDGAAVASVSSSSSSASSSTTLPAHMVFAWSLRNTNELSYAHRLKQYEPGTEELRIVVLDQSNAAASTSIEWRPPCPTANPLLKQYRVAGLAPCTPVRQGLAARACISLGPAPVLLRFPVFYCTEHQCSYSYLSDETCRLFVRDTKTTRSVISTHQIVVSTKRVISLKLADMIVSIFLQWYSFSHTSNAINSLLFNTRNEAETIAQSMNLEGAAYSRSSIPRIGTSFVSNLVRYYADVTARERTKALELLRRTTGRVLRIDHTFYFAKDLGARVSSGCGPRVRTAGILEAARCRRWIP